MTHSEYLCELLRASPQLGVAKDMLKAGKWSEREHELVKFDLPQLRKLYDFQFHWEQMSFAIEQRFEQTSGLSARLKLYIPRMRQLEPSQPKRGGTTDC